jgi:copper chaperone CopZ
MRQLFVATVAAVAVAGLGASQVRAGKVEITGVHLCCKSCVTAANKALAKADGLADVKCDQKTKSITFTANDDKALTGALQALMDAGFYGTATNDGKVVAFAQAGPKKGDKADEITVKGVHVCCKRCQDAVTALLKGAKVSFSGSGAQKDVKISGKDLDKAEVLKKLEKGGFFGKVE